MSAAFVTIGLNSIVVLYNREARQNLGVTYSRERRSVGSPLSCKGQGPLWWKVSLVNKSSLVDLYKVRLS
jgi:hypothetical protein